MKSLKIYVIAVLLTIGFLHCTSSTEPNTSTNAPSDHTVNKSGVLHKSGLQSALTNCVSCHGADLKGGDVGVSCYSCHGKKWQG
jgi:cytochrome c553